jgi:hypothetical protein
MSESSSGESNASGTVLAIVLVFVAIGGVAYWMNGHRERPADDVAIALGVDEDDTRKVSARPPAAPAEAAVQPTPTPEIPAAPMAAPAGAEATTAAPTSAAPATPPLAAGSLEE